MWKRIESPSSINTYKQCPRKYYYQYVAGLKTSPSIHLIRGKIAHSVLEDFFKIDISKISSSFDFELKIILHEMLSRHWNGSRLELENLKLSPKDVDFYLDETKQMLQFWLIDFLSRLQSQMENKTLVEAFNALKPRTEEYLKSEAHGVHGYVDAIHEADGFVKIIDYKTSKKDYIDEAYKLQLAIYALLYNEKYGKVPDLVGIHFLKFCEKTLKVDQKLLDFAACECKKIHEKNKSTDMADYPKSISPLCSWSRGCCDFYGECKK